MEVEILEVDNGSKLLEGSLWIDLEEGERCLGTSFEFRSELKISSVWELTF